MFLRMRDGILHPEKIDPDALVDTEKRAAVMARTGQEIYEYFGTLADERMRKPADDVMSKFVVSEVDGERLSHEGVVDICYLMLIAGSTR